ncbi:sensor histidine kinase [uncultured Brevundimonas sp.]|uniref:sensor histidine kinase PhyK n=1 Tax=uncultured Brevundimonas sp. TaxID=213418 RepID=UPI0030EBF2AF|tara:strand:+ start:18739 stop:20427 length:1689 start_codon:yes stop_codon:yes gene_type:complete
MSVALLPIVILGAIQTQSDFRTQAEDRRSDLQLAAQRSATGAKSLLDSTAVLLQTLRPEGLQFFCEPRLTSVVERLDNLTGLVRISATGQPVCASSSLAEPPPWLTDIRASDWYRRLRAGEAMTLAQTPATPASEPGLIVAIRLERPLGTFDGAMLALIPLSSLRPDTADPALPEGSEAALTDGRGRILTATDLEAFKLGGGMTLRDWVLRTRNGDAAMFEAKDRLGQPRAYAGAALAGRDVYVLLSAPAPGLLSWARLNPVGILLLPLAAWLTAFAAVMLVSERIVIRWLDYLERVAAIYARGRFSVRPLQAMNAPSEIRILATTLDTLAETITTRDKALMDSLTEKDALMREIHHRVKNNLQIISSLLSMQQRALTDAPARAAVGDTRRRIAALALIYRTLYQSDDLRYADARIFLTELVGQLVSGEAGRGHVVTSSIEADSLVVDPDKLAPLALWLVEAVTNAQKHAFGDRGGDLKVRFRVEGETSVLEVEDDGVGVDDSRQAGVGRTLMTAFAKQLRGTTEIVASPEGGSIARMTFATPEAVTPIDPTDLGTARFVRR